MGGPLLGRGHPTGLLCLASFSIQGSVTVRGEPRAALTQHEHLQQDQTQGRQECTHVPWAGEQEGTRAQKRSCQPLQEKISRQTFIYQAIVGNVC